MGWLVGIGGSGGVEGSGVQGLEFTDRARGGHFDVWDGAS